MGPAAGGCTDGGSAGPVTTAIGIIAFVVALLVSVMLHEFGHFLTAKAFGMKASRFFVGFGPTLWSFRRGETEYGVKAIPAGGFVKIEGMTQLEELEPGDEDRAFWRQPAGRRTIVLVSGSLVHFIIAIGIIFSFLAITHDDPIRSVTKVASISKCVQPVKHCPKHSPPPPAVGKLQRGDVITGIDGKSYDNVDDIVQAIQQSAGTPLTLNILRDGRPISVRVKPAAVRQDGRTVGKIGFAPDPIPAHVTVAASFGRTFTALGDYARLTGKALGNLPGELSDIFAGKPRNPNGAASVVDIARVSGQIASDSGLSVGDRVWNILLITAELNFFVGIFNLLPLLPLDGGHVAILAFESARSRLYRLFGRRDPGRVDIVKLLPVTYAVVAAFVALALILIYAGITNPITIQ
jgi:membrane-associated protease RseP (regulator of RpoE activity)